MDNRIFPGVRALVKWDWSTSNLANKWQDLGDIFNIEYSPSISTSENNAQIVDIGDNVSVIKLGVFGTGRAFRFRFESVGDRPLTLHGWAVAGSEEVNP